MTEHRWVLLEMIQEPIQPGLPDPYEASARQHCLHESVKRISPATSCRKTGEKERLTADSLNGFVG